MEFLTISEQVEGLRQYAANPQQRVRTGFESLDLLTDGGVAPGEVYTIMGRTYAGKSLVATAIMVANKHLGSLFFCLEMPYRQALIRLLAQYTDLPAPFIRQRMQKNDLGGDLDNMAAEMSQHVIVDQPRLNTVEMARYVEHYEEVFGKRPAFITIDYLELVGGVKHDASGWQATEAQAQAVKELAKETNIGIFLLHQTNRTEDDWKPPTLRSGRGGGDIEADFVVGLWQPARDPELPPYERRNLWPIRRFTLLKNRWTGEQNMPWQPLEYELTDSLRFRDLRAGNGGY